MTYLTPYLPFNSSSPLPPPSSHLIVSDTLSAPCELAIYHLVSAACSKKIKVVWVDFRGIGRASLESVLRKLGTALPPSFIHIAPSSVPSQTSSPYLFDHLENPSLRSTFDLVVPLITTESLIILDGLTDLVHLGFSSTEVTRLVRAILPPVRTTRSRLITTLHADHFSHSKSSPDESELIESLMRFANGWWRIEGLVTGRSVDVHGEISAHPLFPIASSEETCAFPHVSKTQPLQYRLETGTVKVFPKGTGRGYL